ncbi:MAG: FkbM family methyltransferase [Candidatus Aenigmatarchaeota archaeon]
MKLYKKFLQIKRTLPLHRFFSDFLFEMRNFYNKVYRSFLPEFKVFKVRDMQAKFSLEKASAFGDFRSDFKFESPILEELLEEIKEGDVFYDIGANIGLYSCFVCKKYPSVKTFAFEPNKFLFEDLKNNLKVNGAENAEIINYALSDEDSEGKLIFPDRRFSSVAYIDSDEKNREYGLNVERKKGDQIAGRDLPLPTVLKIDVEGHELEAVKGLAETLNKDRCRLVYCEIHKDLDYGLDERHGLDRSEIEELKGIFKDSGFDLTSKEISTMGHSRKFLKATK